MAIQMTRAEYEAKYGKPPALPVAKADPVKAEPIKMTRAEYVQKYGITPEQAKILNEQAPNPGIARDKILESLKADTRSSETYKPTFPASIGTDTPLISVMKTAGNLPSSGVGLTKTLGTLALDTAKAPLDLVSGISKQHQEVKTAATATERLIQLQEQDTALSKEYISLPQDDPRKAEIRQKLIQLRGEMEALPKGKQIDITNGNTALGLAKLVGEIATGDTAAKEALKNALIERYGSLDNLQRTAVNDPSGFALDILSILEGGALMVGRTKALQGALSNVAQTVQKPVVGAAGAVVDTTKSAIRSAQETVRAARTAERAAEFEKAVGRITQGTTDDAAVAKRVLPQLEPQKNMGPADFIKQADELKKVKLDKIDKVLETSSKRTKIADMWTKGGKETINYVEEGLKQLEKHFKDSNDIKGLDRINEWRLKDKDGGLSPKDVYDIAREHNSQLSRRNASGEVSKGVSAENAENTRVGIKNTARSMFADGDEAKLKLLQAADAEVGDLIKFKKPMYKLMELANKAEQRLSTDGIFQRFINSLGARLLIGASGNPRAAFSGFLPELGVGSSLDVLEVTKRMEMWMKTIKNFTKDMPQSEVQKALDDILKEADSMVKPDGTKGVQLPKPNRRESVI